MLLGPCTIGAGIVRRWWNFESTLWMLKYLLDMARATIPGDNFYSGALFPNSGLPATPPQDDSGRWRYDEAARGRSFSDQCVVTGDVSADGYYAKLLHWDAAFRSRWGFVVVGDSRCCGVACGPLPGPRRTSGRAELHAILQALTVGVAPLRIHTDYQPL
eukprot:556112-Pyramimonas_sp.AAC.1